MGHNGPNFDINGKWDGQGQWVWWMLTVPVHNFMPFLPQEADWIKGQMEEGSEFDYRHWQILVHMQKKTRLSGMTKVFGKVHVEPTRSDAANDYVWKVDTKIATTEFELGKRPLNRANKDDWDKVLADAKCGNMDNIPADIQVRCYNQLSRITKDFATRPKDNKFVCGIWAWGPPGTGKSYWARETYPDYYLKPLNKWWDSFHNEKHVIMDDVDLHHKDWIGSFLKIWADCYVFSGETKGGSKYFRPDRIIVTSNYSLDEMFGHDKPLLEALKSRFKVHHFERVLTGVHKRKHIEDEQPIYDKFGDKCDGRDEKGIYTIRYYDFKPGTYKAYHCE